jgi:hypothetical protein
MDTALAIRRLAFAEARSNGAEAMMQIARYRTEAVRSEKTDTQLADDFAERAVSAEKLDKRA